MAPPAHPRPRWQTRNHDAGFATLGQILCNPPEQPPDQHSPLHRDHSRLFGHNSYVYPVLARRSRGISVGINLNPDKVCNFNCVYCQVDRRTPSRLTNVDEQILLQELDGTLDLVLSGRLYRGSAVRERSRYTSSVERHRVLGGW